MGNIKHHFKRGNNQNTNLRNKIVLILLIILVALLISLKNKVHQEEYKYKDLVKKTQDKVLEVKRMQSEADITKAVLEIKGSNTERFINEINNNLEYITLTEKGNYTINHFRVSNSSGWLNKTFKQSTVTINFDYSALFSIQVDKIDIYNKDNIVYINYDINNIKVKSIEPSNIAVKTNKHILGKSYNNQEVVSLVDISKDDIYSELNSEEKLKSKSCENINNYFISLGNKIGIDNLVINDSQVIEKSYKFVNKGTIKYNHPNKLLEAQDYIVIHSTACEDVTALQFYNNLNSCTQKHEASVHFYVDDKYVVQCLPTNMQSWNCGAKFPRINCTNQNSISLEICEFSDPDRQVKAINNAVDFVNNVLVNEFPNAKIVKHRDIKSTQCPHILDDKTFNTLFKIKK